MTDQTPPPPASSDRPTYTDSDGNESEYDPHWSFDEDRNYAGPPTDPNSPLTRWEQEEQHRQRVRAAAILRHRAQAASEPSQEQAEPPDPSPDAPNLSPPQPPPSHPPEPPRSTTLACKRVTARQATSAVAYRDEEPEADDPLLAFAPYIHTHPRGNSITPERQRKFVATLAATGIVTQAARSIGKSMEALYRLRHRPGAQGFRNAWDAALDRGLQRMEDCALDQAMRGVSTPIVSGGKILGYWNKPDGAMTRFMLQHRMPERYGVQAYRPGQPAEGIDRIIRRINAAAARQEELVAQKLLTREEIASTTQQVLDADRDGGGSDDPG